MKSRYSIPCSKCCYAYISKDLKKAIKKHKDKLQKKENETKGRKAQTVTFSFASKDFIKGGKRRWL